MDRDLGTPLKSQASTKIRAASGRARTHGEGRCPSFIVPNPEKCPTTRLAFGYSRPSPSRTAYETSRRFRFLDTTRTLASSEAHYKDGTFRKEFYR
jgi:hypothetical protein